MSRSTSRLVTPYVTNWMEPHFFGNKTFLFVKIESWNFQHLYYFQFCKTPLNFNSVSNIGCHQTRRAFAHNFTVPSLTIFNNKNSTIISSLCLPSLVSSKHGGGYVMIWNWKVNFSPKDEIKAAPQDFISPEESSKTNVGGGRWLP